MLGDLVIGEEPRADGLVRRTGTADEVNRSAAFAELMNRELERAYVLATVILGDQAEAEDAVHDAAESAWRRWSELRDPGRDAAWFRRILVNGCRDRLRRRRRRRIVEIDRPLTEVEHPTMRDASEQVALRDELRRAFELLAPDEKIVIALRFHGDQTVPAIATLTGAREGTVKSRLHHALRKLRAAVEEGAP